MSRGVKQLVADDLRKSYEKIGSLMIVNVHGLKGTEVNVLRHKLRSKKIEVHVIKNRLAKRVLVGTALEPIGAFLTGPCAFVTGGASAIDTAKELIEQVKEYPALELRHGIIEGEAEVLSIEAISKRKSRAELQGEIVMLFLSPARRVAGCLNVGGKLAGCIKAIADKLEKGETISKVA